MDWITTANGLIALITGLLGLIGTGVSAYLAIRAWIKATKEKNASEVWGMIQEIAKAAMDEVEHSGIIGSANKKQAAIEIVKKSCKAAGINLDLFLNQLNDFIDNSVEFFNNMSGKDKKEN